MLFPQVALHGSWSHLSSLHLEDTYLEWALPNNLSTTSVPPLVIAYLSPLLYNLSLAVTTITL